MLSDALANKPFVCPEEFWKNRDVNKRAWDAVLPPCLQQKEVACLQDCHYYEDAAGGVRWFV